MYLGLKGDEQHSRKHGEKLYPELPPSFRQLSNETFLTVCKLRVGGGQRSQDEDNKCFRAANRHSQWDLWKLEFYLHSN